MSIKMVCPDIRCRHLHSFPDEARGQVFKCIKCETRFRIPAKRPPLPDNIKNQQAVKTPAAPFVF